MSSQLTKILPIILFAFLFFSFFVHVGFAQTSAALSECASRSDTGATLWDNMQMCRKCGTCTLNDFIRLGVNVANWILGIVGSLALLFFIYGGLWMIISSGKSEEIQKAKTILTNAIIGLIIVFMSWVIINFTVSVLTSGTTIFGRPWYSTPSN